MPAASSSPEGSPFHNCLELLLHDLLQEVPQPPPAATGRPPVVDAAFLWATLLVCVLRGFSSQRALWQRIGLSCLWHFKAVPVTSQAIYQRLARTAPTYLQQLFERLTKLLLDRHSALNDVPWARFAGEIVALDHSTLDAALRKTKLFRDLPRGAPQLLPGQLASVFDLRRQMWRRVEFWPDAQRNEKHNLKHWLSLLEPGTLILADLGFFSFAWFDQLTQEGFYFLSRLRQKTSIVLEATLYEGSAGGVLLCEQWVYLGKYRADRGAHLVRLITITRGKTVHRYITNVLEPTLLPAHAVVELYRRRWDIERAFNCLKTHLNLFLLWSGHPNVVQHQVWATLILSQVVFSLRNELAQQAGVTLREVSLPQLLRWVPELAAGGKDPVALIVQRGWQFGIFRRYRGKEYSLPQVDLTEYKIPKERPPPRASRYAGKQESPSTRKAKSFDGARRKQGWGIRSRRPRQA